MSKSMKIFLNIVVVALVGIVVFLVIRNFMTSGKVKREIKEVYELIYQSEHYDYNAIYDHFDNIVSKDGYAIVEMAAKDYLRNVFEKYVELNEIITDDDVAEILTIANYKTDGPDFTETKDYLKKAKQDILNLEATMLADLNIDTMMAYIVDTNLEDSYVTLYTNLEFFDEDNIKNAKQDLENGVDLFVELIESLEEIIDFLIDNNTQWEIVDDMLYFDDPSLSEQYNQMIEEIANL